MKMKSKRVSTASSPTSTIGATEIGESGLKPPFIFEGCSPADGVPLSLENPFTTETLAIMSAMTDVEGIVITKKDLERYARWKEHWLKEQGKTAEEVDKENQAWLRKHCAGA